MPYLLGFTAHVYIKDIILFCELTMLLMFAYLEIIFLTWLLSK